MIRISKALCLAALACAPALAAMDVSHVTAVMLNYEYRPTAQLGLQLAITFGGTQQASIEFRPAVLGPAGGYSV